MDAIRAEKTLYTFVILPTELQGKEPLCDSLAVTLPAREAEPKDSSENP
ncbi:hypothetical protein ACKLNO_11130 [Neisseriaceae bacterium B1]